MSHRVFDRVDAVVASKFGPLPISPPAAVMRVDGNKKGVFTRERRPKVAAHALRRRWRRLE